MDTKKMLLIVGGAIFAIYILFNILFGGEKFSNSFVATRPEVVKTENVDNFVMNMVVDGSGSMRGYTDLAGLNAEKQNFVSNVCNLLTSFKSKFKSNSTIHCGNNTYNTVGDFSKKLSNDNIFNGGATEIGDLIKNSVEEHVSDTSVCAIVSDMVLSYGISVLKEKGRDYNIIQLDGLGHAIYDAATNAKDMGYDIIIMKYTSDFNGQYYYDCTENNLNTYKPYRGKLMKDRPYYIMLIGKKEYILAVYEKCIKECDALYTSFEFKEGKDAEEIKIEENGTKHFWLTGNDPSSKPGIYTEYDLHDSKSEFNVTYDNFVLPKYIKTENLTIEATEGFNVKDRKYKNNTLSFTLVSPEFDKMNTKNEVVITVSYKRPTNWEHISIKNDVDQPLEELEDKTWAVSTIFENIDKAYFEDEHPSENQVSTSIINFNKN